MTEGLSKKLVEVNFTLTFIANVEEDLVLGLIYDKMELASYGPLEKLPILELPAFIRKQDPNFQNAPHYKFQKDGNVLQMGPKILSFASLNYKGWDSFSKQLLIIINDLKKTGIIREITTISLKYVNSFDEKCILNKTSLKITLNDNAITHDKIFLNTEYFEVSRNFTMSLLLTNRAKLNTQNIEKSIIDLTVIADQRNNLCPSFFNEPNALLNNMHDSVKELYNNLLKEGV